MKIAKCPNCERHVDTDSSRDGLSNPAYYSNCTTKYNNGDSLLSSPYTNTDRKPAGNRVYINRHSVQTTV